jgi:hypothetical protein
MRASENMQTRRNNSGVAIMAERGILYALSLARSRA